MRHKGPKIETTLLLTYTQYFEFVDAIQIVIRHSDQEILTEINYELLKPQNLKLTQNLL